VGGEFGSIFVYPLCLDLYHIQPPIPTAITTKINQVLDVAFWIGIETGPFTIPVLAKFSA
jgi:hypothetical protein